MEKPFNDIDPDINYFDKYDELNACLYYDIKSFSSHFQQKSGDFSMLNFNIRSFF